MNTSRSILLAHAAHADRDKRVSTCWLCREFGTVAVSAVEYRLLTA